MASKGITSTQKALEQLKKKPLADQIVEGFKGIFQAAATNPDPCISIPAGGIAMMLERAPLQARRNWLRFADEVVVDLEKLKAQFDPDRIQDPNYIGFWHRVLGAVQFEEHHEKREAYRAVLLNPVLRQQSHHPWAQYEVMLRALEELPYYGVITLKILGNHQKARREYDQWMEERRKAPSRSPTLWDLMVYATNNEIEQPTYESVLSSLDSRHVITLETVSRSPSGVTSAELINASRILTPFGKEFAQFITLPETSEVPK